MNLNYVSPTLRWGCTFTLLLILFLQSGFSTKIFSNSDQSSDGFDLDSFSRIPVLRGGRVKPLDSVARNILLVLRNKRSALDESGKKVEAIKWLAAMLFDSEEADALKSFLVDHDGLLGLMGKKLTVNGKYYSFNDLEPFLEQIDKAARDAGEKPQEKMDTFDQNSIDLYRSILLYRKVKHTLSPPSPMTNSEMFSNLGIEDIFYDSSKDTDRTSEFIRFRNLTNSLVSNPDTIRMGSNDFAKVVFMLDHYSRSNLWSAFFPIPPETGDNMMKWRKLGESMVGEEPMDSVEKRNLDPSRFSTILRDLVKSNPEELKIQIKQLQETNKLNPTVLFATQYAEAIKLRREVDPILKSYEKLRIAYLKGNASQFNQSVSEIRETSSKRAGMMVDKIDFEKSYNSSEPFFWSSFAYVVIFILAAISWLCSATSHSRESTSRSANLFRNFAYYLTFIVFLAHTFGLLGRMYIEGRPPVTNLYSSALFIGWGAVLLCWLTEKYIRLGIASAMGSLIGFGSLIIAHNLSLDSSLNPSGDTMEMMRAVLDSNFWLATHVVTVTIGYSTTFLAGFLGIAYVFYYLLGKVLTLFGTTGNFVDKLESAYKPVTRTISSMIFGITCFSLFFSLVGTVLGGIWADQSWGRFWGWDAKENGALLIVIWNALILHARWAGIAKIRGISSLAIFGNVVTAWSWFGTNMLGVGLHTYGFMDKAFYPLMIFINSQLLCIVFAYLPSFFNLVSFIRKKNSLA